MLFIIQILDACAAPGSKTVQLIELLHGEESSGIPGNSSHSNVNDICSFAVLLKQ